MAGLKAVGTSQIRTLEQDEGGVQTISHFNTDSASLLIYGTQKGEST